VQQIAIPRKFLTRKLEEERLRYTFSAGEMMVLFLRALKVIPRRIGRKIAAEINNAKHAPIYNSDGIRKD